MSAWLLLARAGGGGGYPSGGGGGGGGGGGDGGGELIFYLIYWLLRLCWVQPVIGLPIVALIVWGFWRLGQEGRQQLEGRTIRRAHGVAPRNRRADVTRAIGGQDTTFDLDALLGRIKVAFVKVQAAWCAHQLTEMRPFVSDGIFERFSLQVAEQQRLGVRDQMAGLTITSVTPAAVTADGTYDVVTVRIAAEASDYQVSLETGERVSGSKALASFVEYWAFLRRRGAASRPGKAGLIEGECPACGAAIELNQWATCAHCKAFLRSGAHDWVLVEITQAIEWREGDPEHVPGVAALVARDPAFNVQHLEDRASVIYWRWVAAGATGDVALLRKLASASCCKALGRRIGNPRRTYHRECAVGSVDLLGVLAGETEDTAVLEVRWVGRAVTARPGREPKAGERTAIQRTLLVLRRAATVRTSADAQIAAAHCHGCGAPESGGASNACEFCGQVLADGTGDWVLDALHDRASSEARALLAQLKDVPAAPVEPRLPSPGGALAGMVQMALADGILDDREQALLEQTAERSGVEAAQVHALIEQARAGTLQLPPPADDDEARASLQSMATVALADGKLVRAERDLLHRVGAGQGLSTDDVDALIAGARRRLLGEAKRELRQARGKGRLAAS